jgi:hypothetical protein
MGRASKMPQELQEGYRPTGSGGGKRGGVGERRRKAVSRVREEIGEGRVTRFSRERVKLVGSWNRVVVVRY